MSSISKKDIIHIATEVVILVGITFYFSSKNKKLSEHIEDLARRLEEQEDIIQKHEKIITQLVQKINSQQIAPVRNQQPNSGVTVRTASNSNNSSTENKLNKPNNKLEKNRQVSKPQTTERRQEIPKQQIKVSFSEDREEKIPLKSESESENESDLDEELAEELQELENSNSVFEIDEDGLKKRT